MCLNFFDLSLPDADEVDTRTDVRDLQRRRPGWRVRGVGVVEALGFRVVGGRVSDPDW